MASHTETGRAASARIPHQLAGKTCTAPPERSDRMRDIVVSHVATDRPIRLLDIGAGTGSLLFRLADALPMAELIGIDISSANTRAALAKAVDASPGGRLRFETADYFDYAAAPFDAIVADGVLHLVAGDTTALVRKLAGDLRPGGVLICAMPYDCAYNRIFAILRRLLRAVRVPLTDRVILAVGRVLHGRAMSDQGLRERVEYMYIPPIRMMNDTLRSIAGACGLRVVAEYPMKNTSPSQLRHAVTVFTCDERGAAGDVPASPRTKRR